MKRQRLLTPLFPDEVFFLSKLADGYIIQPQNLQTFKYMYVFPNYLDITGEELEPLLKKKIETLGFQFVDG